MKDVKGWDYGSVYNSDKYISRPSFEEYWVVFLSGLLTRVFRCVGLSSQLML